MNTATAVPGTIVFWDTGYLPTGMPSYESNYYSGFTMCPLYVSTYQLQFCIGLNTKAYIRVTSDSGTT
jgi:hypothetical protein